MVHIHARSLAMAELKQVSLSPSGLTKTLDFILRFSRHGRLETSFTLLIWLNENVHLHACFLAMAEYEWATLFILINENIANLVKISNIRNILTLKKNIILLIGLSFAEYLLNLTVGI